MSPVTIATVAPASAIRARTDSGGGAAAVMNSTVWGRSRRSASSALSSVDMSFGEWQPVTGEGLENFEEILYEKKGKESKAPDDGAEDGDGETGVVAGLVALVVAPHVADGIYRH